MSAGVAELADWLVSQEVDTVVMEATGVYWKPVYYGLEGLVGELWLVNAAHVKRVPGRKTDLSDAEWLADVAAHGMVRPSFVPSAPIRELRELSRYRKTQIDARAMEMQHLEKLLQDAGIKLTSVASRTWSKSAQAMVEALIAGERDPQRLAELSKSRMRAKKDQLTKALAGRFDVHHGVVARQILDHIAFLDASIARLTAEIVERTTPLSPPSSCCVGSRAGVAGRRRCSSPRPAATCPPFRAPGNWRHGPAWLQEATSRPASGGPSAPATATAGWVEH